MPGPPSRAVPAVLHGGEMVLPEKLVSTLERILTGQFSVSMNIGGDGQLARMVREAAYDAFVEIISEPGGQRRR